MSVPALPSLDRTSPTFRTELDAFFLSQLPATTGAFNSEIERINAIGYGSYNATSPTSLTIGTGGKSLTVETGRGFSVGQALLIASTASPANYMIGQVTGYDSETGVLTVNVTSVNGSGTAAVWTISVTALETPAVIRQRTITGADTLIASDQGKLINAGGAFTLSVTAAATLGGGWYCYVRNTSNGDVLIDPASSEQIDGAATFALKPSCTVLVTCNGTAFTVLKIKWRNYDNIASYTASGTFVVPADTYVLRGYAWGRGADGATDQGGAGGGCAYGDIAVTPGETVTVTIASNIATVTTAGVDRLTANPASGVTPGTANRHASVTSGGAHSGGYGQSGGLYGGAASGSPLGVGGDSGAQQGGAAWGGHRGFTYSGAGIGQPGQNLAGGSSLRTPANLFSDPLLTGLTGSGGMGVPSGVTLGVGGSGGPGGGGGGAVGGTGGLGGIGAGGGGGGSAFGGDSLFGGGGGRGPSRGGNGGLGGGGGGAGAIPGTGGAACVLIYY